MGYGFRQWSFVADMNGDFIVTISDVWLWIKWLYFYPGDALLYGVMQGTSSIAAFFEISPESYGGIFSGIVSFFAWLILLSIMSVASVGQNVRAG